PHHSRRPHAWAVALGHMGHAVAARGHTVSRQPGSDGAQRHRPAVNQTRPVFTVDKPLIHAAHHGRLALVHDQPCLVRLSLHLIAVGRARGHHGEAALSLAALATAEPLKNFGLLVFGNAGPYLLLQAALVVVLVLAHHVFDQRAAPAQFFL